MVDNAVITDNIRDMASVGAPLGVTIFGTQIALKSDLLMILYFISVSCGILWMVASFIYKVHNNRKQSKAHDLDIQERELRIKRELMEIERLENA